MSPAAAADRVSRLLTIVPWIASQEYPTITEICERFSLTEKELLEDLAFVPFVGRYPYTPDELIDIRVEEDHVHVEYGNYFARPLRLTREEAVTLLTTGKAAMDAVDLDPGEPLARGLQKVAGVLGVDLDADLRVALTDSPSDIRTTLEQAVEQRVVVEIHHFSTSRNEMLSRAVEPLQVFHSMGAWYVAAFCRRSEAVRVFRLDRIEQATPTDDVFDTRDDEVPTTAFVPRPEMPRVTLELRPGGAWAASEYPVDDRAVKRDGTISVTLAVTSRPWLERLLLRLGPDGRVVDGPADLVTCGGDAASRLLARYGDT